MVMNEEEVREECVKLAELSGKLLREKEELEEIAHDQSREIFEYKTIIAGAQNKEQGLTIQEYQEIKNKQIRELEEMVAGAQNKEQELYREKELLLDHIFGMCEMIYYQVPLKEQDGWMDTMIEQGYYKKPED